MRSPNSRIVLQRSQPRPVLSGQLTVITVASPALFPTCITTASSLPIDFFRSRRSSSGRRCCPPLHRTVSRPDAGDPADAPRSRANPSLYCSPPLLPLHPPLPPPDSSPKIPDTGCRLETIHVECNTWIIRNVADVKSLVLLTHHTPRCRLRINGSDGIFPRLTALMRGPPLFPSPTPFVWSRRPPARPWDGRAHSGEPWLIWRRIRDLQGRWCNIGRLAKGEPAGCRYGDDSWRGPRTAPRQFAYF